MHILLQKKSFLGHFDNKYLAEGLLSQNPHITFLLSDTMQYAQYNNGPLSLVF